LQARSVLFRRKINREARYTCLICQANHGRCQGEREGFSSFFLSVLCSLSPQNEGLGPILKANSKSD